MTPLLNDPMSNSTYHPSENNVYIHGRRGTVLPDYQLNVKRSKEIIKMLFNLGSKLEDYIVQKQSDHFTSLNSNYVAKLKDINSQRVIMEKMRGKALTGVFRADRLKGERIQEILKDLEQENTLKSTGLKLTDKINDFEGRNGE